MQSRLKNRRDLTKDKTEWGDQGNDVDIEKRRAKRAKRGIDPRTTCPYCTRIYLRPDACTRHMKKSCKAPGAPNHVCIEICKADVRGTGAFKATPEKRKGRKPCDKAA